MKKENSQETLSFWQRIPRKLRTRYFEQIDKEFKRTKKRLKDKKKKLEQLRPKIKSKKVPENEEWKDWTIVAVDGSQSMDERVGERYGNYCAGYLLFEGGNLTDEGYRSGTYREGQSGLKSKFRKKVNLLRWNLEREIANYCLEKFDPDLILLDGSFYGFRVKSEIVKGESINKDFFKNGDELITSIKEKTNRLLLSDRAVGIIKTTQTKAIQGWWLYKEGKRLRMNDKEILNYLIPASHWFSYEWLLGNNFNQFNKFPYEWDRRKKERNKKRILKKAGVRFRKRVKMNLGEVTGIFNLRRYFVNTGEPLFFETHKSKEIDSILSFLNQYNNPDSGLPLPIDLIDQEVSLPKKFSRKFTEEIEARLISDEETPNPLVSNTFGDFNPQRSEKVARK